MVILTDAQLDETRRLMKKYGSDYVQISGTQDQIYIDFRSTETFLPFVHVFMESDGTVLTDKLRKQQSGIFLI